MNSKLFVGAVGAVLTISSLAAFADTPPNLSNVVLFNTNASGANQNTVGNIISHGSFMTVLDQQNVPGNYGAELFVTKVTNPTASDFLTPAASPSIPLSVGSNTFYFYGDNNDPLGGTNGFGINLYFNGAAGNSPSLSGYRLNTAGTLLANSSSTTASWDYKVIPGTGALSVISGGYQITLSDFVVTAIGGSGGNSSVDLVNSTNVSPFTPPSHPDGITDTYGQFTLTVAAVPEPASMTLLGAGVLACLCRRSRRQR